MYVAVTMQAVQRFRSYALTCLLACRRSTQMLQAKAQQRRLLIWRICPPSRPHLSSIVLSLGMRRRRQTRNSSHMGCQAGPSRMVGQPRNHRKCTHINENVIPERNFDSERSNHAAVNFLERSRDELTKLDIAATSSAQGTKEQLHVGIHHSQTLEPQDMSLFSVVLDTQMAQRPCIEALLCAVL